RHLSRNLSLLNPLFLLDGVAFTIVCGSPAWTALPGRMGETVMTRQSGSSRARPLGLSLLLLGSLLVIAFVEIPTRFAGGRGAGGGVGWGVGGGGAVGGGGGAGGARAGDPGGAVGGAGSGAGSHGPGILGHDFDERTATLYGDERRGGPSQEPFPPSLRAPLS